MRRYLMPFVAVVIFFAIQGIAGAVVALPQIIESINDAEALNDADSLVNSISPVALALSVAISGIVTIVVMHLMKMIDWRQTLDFASLSVGKSLAYVVAGLIGIFGFDILTEITDLPNNMEDTFLAMSASWIGWVAIGVVGPICEELIFREGVLGGMLRNGVRPWAAIIIAGVVFGMVHANPQQIPFAAAIGIIFGCIYWRTGNIIVTSIIHIINNSVAVWQMNLVANGGSDTSLTELLGGTPYAIALAIVCILLCGAIIKKISSIEL